MGLDLEMGLNTELPLSSYVTAFKSLSFQALIFPPEK